ncbi:TPA: response regulator transcription factor [Vibrio parahaemolyticus]|uniref:response regulator transcription factor n=1 Tax=Vibrio parahaemolyticus TaxID=670 RepID=UPI0004D91645|nr:response regulator transcription factor [Vibrio parahaemolyticus]EJC7060812.1 response regulator transcription factor [Vibrio parahaemolyticus]ODY23180.1 hypothetical protein BBM16_00470 [Vibrio parahaemolyticus]OQU49810.1 hypothetical protein EM74_009835 [Vibrio parahaemolyticus]
MTILVVEDDEHKSSQITALLEKEYPNLTYEITESVWDAVTSINKCSPEMVILDMSLPSHRPGKGVGNPLSMPTGGIEVLFELRKLALRELPILILTQYPEIEIESEPYALNEASDVFLELYGMTNITISHYDNDSEQTWRSVTRTFLG